MSDQQQQPQRKENILSEDKLRMYGPVCPGADRAPVLIPDIFENNPRLRVRTNVQNDANKGYIEAPMNSKVFSKLMEGIRKLANNELRDEAGQPMNGFRVENFGHPFIQNQRSKEKRITSITSVTKNERGVINISITAGKNRPLIEFMFLEDDYHYFKDMNGNPMPESVSSALAAIAWANMMEKYVAIALTEHVVPAWKLKRQQQNAQGGAQWGNQQRPQGGGNQWGGGNGQQGGYQQQRSAQQPAAANSMDSFDIDIPL